jgi:hypothetical protein
MGTEWEKHLDAMTIDEMFAVRQAVQDILGERLMMRKAEIDRKLKTLNRLSVDVRSAQPRSNALSHP